jgi:hypothetical protein
MTVLILVGCIIFETPVIAGSKKKGIKKYYLSQSAFTGSQATTACEKGFHMAALWEIFETSNLHYDATLGITHPEAASGPPVGFGWIRTSGSANNMTNIPGLDNCQSWTVDDGKGTAVSLAGHWNDTPSVISPWVQLLLACGNTVHVWCVQD